MKTNNTQSNKGITKKIIETSLVFVFMFMLVTHTYASAITSKNVISLINNERAARDLPKLKEDQDLDISANLKSKDMINRNYFEHYAFGLTPWDFIKLSGYDYLYAGENLAMDFNTAEGMVSAWMKSPTHRDNILNPDYTDTGVGVVKGDFTENGITRSTTMVTNDFGRKKPAILKAFEYLTNNIFKLY